MKRIVLILAVAAAVGCARPVYVSKSDLAGARMHGAVSQIRETLSSGGIVETYTEVNYNRAGNVTVQSIFAGPERTPISREEYTYDPSGERVEKYVERNLVKSTFSTVYYTYDEAGRMVAQGNKLWGPARTEFTYDRRVQYYKDSIQSVALREIDYFGEGGR